MKNKTMITCSQCHQNVIVDKKTTNHILHIILSIITVGWWLIIYAFMAINSTMEKDGKCPICTPPKKWWQFSGII